MIMSTVASPHAGGLVSQSGQLHKSRKRSYRSTLLRRSRRSMRDERCGRGARCGSSLRLVAPCSAICALLHVYVCLCVCVRARARACVRACGCVFAHGQNGAWSDGVRESEKNPNKELFFGNIGALYIHPELQSLTTCSTYSPLYTLHRLFTLHPKP